ASDLSSPGLKRTYAYREDQDLGRGTFTPPTAEPVLLLRGPRSHSHQVSIKRAGS
ncbi:hypothetical protein XENOCAPTIV_028790, partial [Xenoophorus captivus]